MRHRLQSLAGLISALAVLGLGACAGHPRGMLLPVDVPAKTTVVDLLAATTRDPAEDPGVLFGGGRGAGVSYANITVSLPEGRPVGSVQWPRNTPGDPSTDFVVSSVTPLPEDRLLDWFKKAGGKKRRVFVFVHGFNTRFDTATFRFAQLAHDSDADAAPVLFSWPSRGRLLDYKLDHQNATYSRSDLARLLRAAASSPSVGEITILAHSMGGWLAVEALRQIALQDRGVPSKIKNLILASPDLDIGVFRRQLEDIGPRRPRVTLFVSQNDRALRLSRLISGGMTRLGAVDLTSEAYQQQLADLPGVTVIDLSALSGGDRINHSLYAESPVIVRLIGDRLIDGQVMTDADASFPLVAGDVIGAAGTVLATPFFIIDSAAQSR
ncbi:alpha/beta hydrolase [Microvirga antarctica]|uniref:alpha/beta hydrolase n=1 Tax=Microvirga antarctica TaxID=2819233 RepID=UPI001FEC4328|nr:alpha/beta hydrolase [Microvirga antarctica]